MDRVRGPTIAAGVDLSHLGAANEASNFSSYATMRRFVSRQPSAAGSETDRSAAGAKRDRSVNWFDNSLSSGEDEASTGGDEAQEGKTEVIGDLYLKEGGLDIQHSPNETNEEVLGNEGVWEAEDRSADGRGEEGKRDEEYERGVLADEAEKGKGIQGVNDSKGDEGAEVCPINDRKEGGEGPPETLFGVEAV
eukprot:GHVN01042099.1.p1 GENE.GHVN01042099.1~~GHVN01042099.1.p1  ORF type:complete len:193 (-),score=50.25 GHVN01042099.1:632-1210(-)